MIKKKDIYGETIKYIEITLLAVILTACDDKKKDSISYAKQDLAIIKTTSQTISLLSSGIIFMLPEDMHEQSGKIRSQSNNMHVYADGSSQRVMIVIIGESTNETLPVLAKRLEDQQRARDSKLLIINKKTIKINGNSLQQLNSIFNSDNRKQFYSSILLGNVDN